MITNKVKSMLGKKIYCKLQGDLKQTFDRVVFQCIL